MRYKPLPIILFVSAVFFVAILLYSGDTSVLSSFIVLISTILTLQGAFTLVWMLYAWDNPERAEENKSPETFINPKYSFSALLPARHEEKVIGDTLRALTNINYPKDLMEILVLLRKDDTETVNAVYTALSKLPKSNVRLVIFNDEPINKPHGLNYGLRYATGDVLAVFDAEDEPHPDIYNIVNTLLSEKQTDVVQSGVQLMNYRSNWFSALNCIEYFFWFKSGLLFFSQVFSASPLGGNTVFFKKDYLEKIGGWDESCLTEDADIGIRLAIVNAKTTVVYDAIHATREETPPDTKSFLKQRTRWNQGFMQVFSKGQWLRLPKLRQKIIVSYILLSPFMQAFLFFYTPFALIIAFQAKLSVLVSLFSFLPFMFLFLQLAISIVALYEFCKEYKLSFPLWMPVKIIIAFVPYQIILAVAAIRALFRFSIGTNGWEKTHHTNAHRL